MALVPIPWQPHLFVAPSYMARLERASKLAGHNIYLNSVKSSTGRYLSAWRALEEAIYVYDLYKNHGGPVASNPYTGKRYHLRGAGGDILLRSDRQYMLAAGFLPDPDEWWHFSDPNWATMPIIAINSQTAGHGTVPLDIDSIKKGETMVIKRSATGEVAIFGSDYAQPDGSKRGRHVFASVSDYNGFKSVTDWVRDHEGGDSPELPALGKVIPVDENGWGVVCRAYGV